MSLLLLGSLSGPLSAAEMFYPAPSAVQVEMPSAATPGRIVGSYWGEIYYDLNRNGIRELNEEGAANVLVRMETVDGELYQETHTDENGYYLFTNLSQDEFVVRVVLPDIFQITTEKKAVYTVTISEVGSPSDAMGICICLFLPSVQGQ
jgi:hypothetical protein